MKKTYKNIEWHIFSDGVDEYTETLKEANEIWREWKKDGYTNIRIYKNYLEYDDIEKCWNTTDIEEGYRAIGAWPY